MEKAGFSFIFGGNWRRFKVILEISAKYCEPFVGDGILVIRNIPCYKCKTCDEIQFTGDVVKKLEKIIAYAKKHIQKLSVANYATAA